MTFNKVLMAGAGLLLFLMAGRTLAIALHIPLTYNEGWNAYFSLRAVTRGTGPLYPSARSPVFNNYPPLSFLLVGALGRWVFGDMIVAGRVVALLSLLMSAALVAVCVRRLGGVTRAGLAAALLVLLFACTFYHDYLAMDDPQWLAHALMLGGLAVLLRNRAGPRLPAPDVVLAALLMLTGGFVKHNLIALPLAVTVWLGFTDRAAFLAWVAAGAIGLGAAAIALEAGYGPAVFTDVLRHQRIVRLDRFAMVPLDLLPLLPMVLIAATARTRQMRGASGVVFCGLFIGVAVVAGVAERLGEGANYNVYLEALIAASLGFGLGLSRWLDRSPAEIGRYGVGPNAVAVFAALPLLVMTPAHLPRAWRDIADAPRQQRLWRPLIGSIARLEGPAMCETLALCYWAGKPFAIDLFNLSQSVLAVGMRPDRLRSIILGPPAFSGPAFSVIEYQLASSIHADVVRQIGQDPIEQLLVGQCSVEAIGPHGMIVIRPGA